MSLFDEWLTALCPLDILTRNTDVHHQNVCRMAYV